jgi:CBS domain-containing protein
MSTDSDGTLTPEERRRVEEFRRAFAAIEAALKRRLRLPEHDRGRLKTLIDRYRAVNPYWEEEARALHQYREIRNFLTHPGDSEHGYPVAVSPRTLRRVETILQGLQHPPLVSESYRKRVTVVASADSLSGVLRLAYENEFSQFPVVDGGRFQGVITEHEVTRWLGRQAVGGRDGVDLAGVTVGVVLEEREQERRERPIFRFGRLDSPLDEILGLFVRNPVLEVVLLTAGGGGDGSIEGIVTQWDAARPRRGHA